MILTVVVTGIALPFSIVRRSLHFLTAEFAAVSNGWPFSTLTNLQQATGFALVGSFAGTLFGPAFGGMLYEAGGYSLPFVVAAGLVLVDGAARMFLLKDPPRHSDNEKATLRTLVKSPAIVILAGVIVITSATIALLSPRCRFISRRTLAYRRR